VAASLSLWLVLGALNAAIGALAEHGRRGANGTSH